MKTKIQAIAVLVAVLLLGCLIGSAGSWLRYGKRMNVRANEKSEGSQLLSQHGEQHLSELLEMTSEQRIRYEDVMKESRDELDNLSREQRLKIDAVIAEANKKIQSILNAEQKTKLERSLQEINRGRERGSRGKRGSGSSSPSPKQVRERPLR